MKRSPLRRSSPPKKARGTTAAKKKRRVKTANIKAKDAATILHSQYVRARDGRCVRCGAAGEDAQLQCAHIVPRRCAATRTDENNAAALCAACHMRLTEWPNEHVGFFTTYLGSWAAYQALIDKAQAGLGKSKGEAFWQGEIDRLNELMGALDG